MGLLYEMRPLRGSKAFWVFIKVFDQNEAAKGYWWISKVLLLKDFGDFGEMKGFLMQVRNKRGKGVRLRVIILTRCQINSQ